MEKPTPPLSRIIREGDFGDCPKCGSSRKCKYGILGFIFNIKSEHCIQPECENYYGK